MLDSIMGVFILNAPVFFFAKLVASKKALKMIDSSKCIWNLAIANGFHTVVRNTLNLLRGHLTMIT